MQNELKLERRAKRTWISLVVLLLGLQLVIGGFAIHIATGDRSTAIVPDYHNAALNWDSHQQRRDRLRQLDWKLNLEVAETPDGAGRRVVRVQVHDDQGNGVDDLNIDGTVFHHARARKIVPIQLESIGDGSYQQLLPIDASGLWEFEFEFDAAEQAATEKRIMEVR